MFYPKDVPANLKFRSLIIDEALKDPSYANILWHTAKVDPVFFFNAFLWAEDPFADKGLRYGVPRHRIRPIVTYDFQDEFIRDLVAVIEKGEDLVADKSRDMLATYMVLGVFLHNWLFFDRKFVISSWKEDEIDGKDDTSTHFGKLRFFLKNMPAFMLPKGFNWKKNSSYMKLQTPQGGTLTGSAASASLGSGRREDAFFFDELAKWEKNASEAWTSASDATKCKIGVWTPKGSGNKAAELMAGPEVKNKKHLMWFLHPEKCYTSELHLRLVGKGEVYDKVRKYVVESHPDQSKAPSGCYVDANGRVRSEWYDKDCEVRTPEDIAENLDCDYLTTGRPVFDTVKCQKRLYESAPGERGDLVWKVAPYFTPTGECANKSDLAVDFIPNMNGLFEIWDRPKDGFDSGYCIGADTAEGLEQGDFDAAYVLFRPEARFVARLHGHIRIHEYAELLAKFGVYYKFAAIAVERNNHGHGVILQLLRLYRQLWHKEIFTKGYGEITDKLGFDTTSQTKPIILGTLGKWIGLETIKMPDEKFWRETLTFVEDNGRMEAQGKSRGDKVYDDCIMGAAITLHTHLNMPLPSQKESEEVISQTRKFKSRQKQGQLLGFGL